MEKNKLASDEETVSALYKDTDVAQSYIDQRFSFSWNRLLHDRQVSEINNVIRDYAPSTILEVAPGPVRIATDLVGVKKGVMVEYSKEMIEVGNMRLRDAGQDNIWDLRHGNAFELSKINLQFDFLYTFRFIRHFHTEERIRLYQEMNSCLQPNGLIMFDVVNESVREKLNSKNSKPKDELDVYDVLYTENSFKKEMSDNNFEVLRMVPVICHFDLQSFLSYKFDDRIRPLSNLSVKLLEKISSKNPLEWVALCRKN